MGNIGPGIFLEVLRFFWKRVCPETGWLREDGGGEQRRARLCVK